MTSVLKTRIKSPLPKEDLNESPKLIVISGEGPVTEEIYFNDILANICLPIRHKIRIASTREDFYQADPTKRTQEGIDNQNKSQPRQVMERMDNYLSSQTYIQQSKRNDDEFWLVLDIDDHTDQNHVDEWNAVLSEALEKKYKYAVSNPFFEVWLLLHHCDHTAEDEKFQVTDTNFYTKTDHFKERLKNLGVPLTGNPKKIPEIKDYDLLKIKAAITRAKVLHGDSGEFKKWPESFGSTVYI